MTNLSEIPTWLLIIPLLIFVLVLLRRRKRSVKKISSRQLPPEYFTGLNYLLNDEHGKALDVFVKLVETDWDLVDTILLWVRYFVKMVRLIKP